MRLFTLHLTAPSLLERAKCRGLIHRGLPSGRHRKLGSPSRVAPLPATRFSHLPDGLIAAADAGATCAIQPGGSMRDEEVIAAADEREMAMIFTGVRHFRH